MRAMALLGVLFISGTMIVNATYEVCGRLDWIIEKVEDHGANWICPNRPPE